MKTKITLVSLILSSALQAQTFTEQTIDLESGYEKDVYYHLNETANEEDGDDWHLAFSLGNGSASILFQESRGNAIYATDFDIADWNTVDTVGLSSQTPLYNSPISWDQGALNEEPANPSSGFDLGWGSYDIVTHFVNGSRVFIAEIGDDFYKIYIKSLKSGKYEFQYQEMVSGSALETETIQKSDYSDRSFVHFNLEDGEVFLREPEMNDWQFVVGKYIEHIPTPYPVVGIKTRKGIEVAQIENTHPDDVDLTNLTFSEDINTVGYDWKSFNMASFAYDVTDSLSYVLKNEAGEMTHFYFTEYEGTSTGIIKLMVKSINLSTEEHVEDKTRFTAFNDKHIAKRIQLTNLDGCDFVNILSVEGKVISSIQNPNSIEQIDFSLNGIYFISAQFNNTVETIKVSL